MQPHTRWKLACAVLAGVTILSFVDRGDSPATVATPGRMRSAAVSKALPLRATSRAPIEDLVRRLRAARTVTEIHTLAQQLGVIGDDRAIDDIRSMIGDLRPGVPSEVMQAIGMIGSDHAVAVLVEAAQGRDRDAALDALGMTHNPRAEELLGTTASSGDLMAILALGHLGTDHAIELLVEIATTMTGEEAHMAVAALGDSESPAAEAALRKLVDSPSIEVTATAIGALTKIDDEMFAKLTGILASGEVNLVEPALAALANAGTRAIPILLEAALHGPPSLRATAVGALSRIASPEVAPALGAIMDTGDEEAAHASAEALGKLGTEAARELLIAAAKSQRSSVTHAVDVLLSMHGPEVEHALLQIAGKDHGRRVDILAHLIGTGSAEATQYATDLVTNGSDDDRAEGLEMFASAGTKAATHALVMFARTQTGDAHVEALRLLAKRPGDPEVARLLQDTLLSGKPDEAAAAAAALAKAGTSEARDALVAALSNGDDELTAIAMDSLAEFRLTDDVSAALVAAAHANPDLAPQVMRRLVGDGAPAGFAMAESLLGAGGGPAYDAIETLQRVGTPGAVRLIEGAMSSKDVDLRRNAVAALGSLRAEGAEETVIGALRDGDSTVRETAVRSLGELGTAGAKSALIDLSRSGTADDKLAVIGSLSGVEDPAVTQALTGMIRDTDPTVSMQAMDAAATRGADITRDLQSMVSSPSLPLEVRARAARWLRDSNSLDPRVEEALEKELGDTYGNAEDLSAPSGM